MKMRIRQTACILVLASAIAPSALRAQATKEPMNQVQVLTALINYATALKQTVLQAAALPANCGALIVPSGTPAPKSKTITSSQGPGATQPNPNAPHWTTPKSPNCQKVQAFAAQIQTEEVHLTLLLMLANRKSLSSAQASAQAKRSTDTLLNAIGTPLLVAGLIVALPAFPELVVAAVAVPK